MYSLGARQPNVLRKAGPHSTQPDQPDLQCMREPQGSAPALTLLTLGMTGMVAAGTLEPPLAQRSALGAFPVP